MAVRVLIMACVLFLGMCFITSGKPTPKKKTICKIIWQFGIPCDQVSSAIVTEIKTLDTYELGSVTASAIQANYTSSVGQVENLNFTIVSMPATTGCRVDGKSLSSPPSDNGTNYCSLHTVIQGSGLTEAPGFTEFTNKWMCNGYVDGLVCEKNLMHIC